VPSPVGNYMEFFDDAYRALIGKAPNPVPPADGIRIIRLIEAAKLSAINGKRISL
jgi:scyllo-inositol 2-dehydrogenase (NADP+)